MDEFEQSDFEKETTNSHNTCYQNAVRYKQKENVFIKNCQCGLFSFVFVIKLGGGVTEIFHPNCIKISYPSYVTDT